MKASTSARTLCQGAVIAALYVVLTFVANALGLASGIIQLRLSEALCVLPIFLPAAVPGLTIGCLLANLTTGAVALDIVVGPIATLIGALGTRALRHRPAPLAMLPPILANAVIVPWIIRYGYGAPDAIWFMFFTVGAGEALSVGLLGGLLLRPLRRCLS